MNHHIFTMFTAAAVLLPGILFSGENLLKNGTIEELKNGNPLPWTQSRNGTSSASVVQEGANHRLHLKKVNDGKSTHTAWAQNVPVKPDTQYRLSGVAEGDGRIFWYELDENKKFILQIRGFSFQKKEKGRVETTSRTSPKTKICQIRFEIYGKARAAEGFLDDVHFEVVEEAPAKSVK